MKTSIKLMEDKCFCIAGNMETLTPNEGFEGTIKNNTFQIYTLFHLSRKWKWNMNNENGKHFCCKEKTVGKPLKRMGLNDVSIVVEFITLSIPCLLFLFSVAPSKIITFGKVHFSSFRTSVKSNLSESVHFRCWDRKCILRNCFPFSFTHAIPLINLSIPLSPFHFRTYGLQEHFSSLHSLNETVFEKDAP